MKEKIKLLKTIHYGLVTSILFGYFMLGDLANISIPNLKGNDFFFIFVPLAAYFTSNLIFKKTLSTIDNKTDENKKLEIYQSASIIRWAILEGACFLILMIKPKLLILGLVILIYMFFVKPNEDHIKQTLKIRQ